MDIIEAVVFSAALSMDAFGIGASCAMRGIRFPLLPKLIICIISVIVTAAAVFSGGILSSVLDPLFCRITGAVLLAALGVYIIVGAARNEQKASEEESEAGLIESTARILQNPEQCDMDKTGYLDFREACFLGAALSADSFAAGIGAGIGGGAYAVPFLCGMFQLVFLCAGEFLGHRLYSRTDCARKLFTFASGVLLVIIAAARLF